MNQNFRETCRKLRLSGLAASLEVRLQEASSHQLPHAQFLELLLQDELNVRAQRLLERRKKAAGFRDLKPLEDFDWGFNPSIKRSQIFDLATGQFIRQHRDVLLLGPPGVGKSFLAQALGHPKTWISVIAEALEKSHISGQGVADIFIELFDKQFESSGYYDGKQDKLPNFFDANEALQKTRFTGRRMLWQDSCSRILKTFIFGPAAGAFNARHPIKLEDLLDKPIIIELDQELPKPLRVFFSDVLLRWIHLFRLAQGETDELRHVTFLEEVHNLFPKTSIERQASNSLENVFREIRGFGEGLVNITQHPSLLPIYILGNCNTQIMLGLQHEEDIFTAKHSLFLNKGEEVYLDRLPVGEGIVKVKGRVNPCHVRFPLVPIKKGAVEDDFTAGGENDAKKGVD